MQYICAINQLIHPSKVNGLLSLTSIAGHVHVNDLDLTTQILVSPCHTCSVYAIKKFGFPCKILRHLWIFLWVLKVFFLIHTILPPSKVIGFLFIDNDLHLKSLSVDKRPITLKGGQIVWIRKKTLSTHRKIKTWRRILGGCPNCFMADTEQV